MTGKKNILVIGSGAREHALVHTLSRSGTVREIHAAPGNPGMLPLAKLHPVSDAACASILPLVKRHGIDLVVVGPEAPLVAGLADELRSAGVEVFGPGRAGALLEGSKVHAKKFMDRWGVPTAPWDECTSLQDVEEALAKRSAPFIVKADGLAAGKGVFVTKTREEAFLAAENLLVRGALGEAGKRIIIEDALSGEELTVLAVSDGATYRILPPSQDHKRVYEEDKGPNTGGMGAYSPVPWVGEELLERVRRSILDPTFDGLRHDGVPYCGVLYAGLMVAPDGIPRVIEYNVRFGDPEAQVVLPLLEVDFAEMLFACCEGRLSEFRWEEPSKWAVDVVLASGGYPGTFEKGKEIEGLENVSSMEDFVLFHGGTTFSPEGKILTEGGRVLSAVGLGASLEEALVNAYAGVEQISFENMHYRRDIARRAIIQRRGGI
ncbi:MAG TPA: phosphoribosylamine--glycine ligase [Aminobacteriaceae bacterium]|nr:phosphoribosylamine--glycine ligase [Aminobacteriaceae bacterium]